MPRFSRRNTPANGDLNGYAATSPPPRRGLFDTLSDDLQAALLEFVGTTVFLMLAFGGVQATGAEQASAGANGVGVSRVMYISLSFGLSLLISAWLFFRVTGGLFNPNVSTALLLAGVIEPVRFVLFCIAQLLGGIAAAALVLALTPDALASNCTLAPGINPAQAVWMEAFTTAILCLAVLMLAAEKHIATPFAPVGIGLTLFACELFSVYYTGGALNTARAFGPAVVTGFPSGTQWVYWVGPGIGSLIAAALYAALKHYRYWTLNPGQDTINFHESPADPVENVISSRRSRSSRRSEDRERERNEKRRPDDSTIAPRADGGSGFTPNDSPV
ncbi:aquaporin-like protein [Phanerochaete sordida]|uniref:Aquaporin-like protein n=1 Tax=Phanerochaete sordida TaxID=48140 RepID=A0A9P3G0N4_9APHY|nr:aquaporin-like protein [Phanerochaete sordida]